MGIEKRQPYLDRRLVDFTFTLSPGLIFRDGFKKYVLRQAMGGVLPEKIRWRIRTSVIDELVERGLRDKENGRAQELFEDAYVQWGLVDAERLLATWTTYQEEGHWHLVRPIIWGLCVEAWLRHLEKSNR